MKKILHNEYGPLLFIDAEESVIQDNAAYYSYVIDPPDYINSQNTYQYHAEGGVIVPGPYLTPTEETIQTSWNWATLVADPTTTIQNIPPDYTGTMNPDLPTTNLIAVKANIEAATTMTIAADLQLWNTAMATSFIILAVAFRSYGCSVVKNGDYVYICTKDHTGSAALTPGTNAGCDVWCPCGDAAVDDGIAAWVVGGVYAEGTIMFLGSPPAFVSMFQQASPQTFTQIKCLATDKIFPEEEPAITDVYYGIRAFVLSDTGGGTTYSGLVSIYGSALLTTIQSITVTKQ